MDNVAKEFHKNMRNLIFLQLLKDEINNIFFEFFCGFKMNLDQLHIFNITKFISQLLHTCNYLVRMK